MKITDILDRLDSVSAMAVVIVIMIVFFILGWFISRRKDISDLWNSWYQNRKKKDELLNMLLNDHDRIDKYEENRKRDREQSFEIQRQLVDANTKLAEQITELSKMMQENQRKTDNRFAESEEKNNKRVRAELKDKIRRSYQVYHERGYWNEMEREALEDLLEEYESHGGTNSFCHSIVQPEMYTWELRPFE